MDIDELIDKFNDGTARISCSNIYERQAVLQYLYECGEYYEFPPIVDEIRIYGKSKRGDCLDYMFVGATGGHDGKICVTLYSRVPQERYIHYAVFQEAINGSGKLYEIDESEFNDNITGLLFG